MATERPSMTLTGEFQDDRRTTWNWEITFEQGTTYTGWGYDGEVWSDTEVVTVKRGGIEGQRTRDQLQMEGEGIARNQLALPREAKK